MTNYIHFVTIGENGRKGKTFSKVAKLGIDITAYEIPVDADYAYFDNGEYGEKKEILSPLYYVGTMFTNEGAKAQLGRCELKLVNLMGTFMEETLVPLNEIVSLIEKFKAPNVPTSSLVEVYREIVSKMEKFINEETVLEALNERYQSVTDCKNAIATNERNGLSRVVKTQTGNWEPLKEEDKVCSYDEKGNLVIND